MISVEVLDQNDHMEAKRDDDRMDLSGTVGISLTKRLASGRTKSI